MISRCDFLLFDGSTPPVLAGSPRSQRTNSKHHILIRAGVEAGHDVVVHGLTPRKAHRLLLRLLRLLGSLGLFLQGLGLGVGLRGLLLPTGEGIVLLLLLLRLCSGFRGFNLFGNFLGGFFSSGRWQDITVALQTS